MHVANLAVAYVARTAPAQAAKRAADDADGVREHTSTLLAAAAAQVEAQQGAMAALREQLHSMLKGLSLERQSSPSQP